MRKASFKPGLPVSVLIAAAALLGACGGGGGSGGSGVGASSPSTPSYSVRMVFPTANANVGGSVEQLDVTGLLIDNRTGMPATSHDISSLEVAGVTASFDSETGYLFKAEGVSLDPQILYPSLTVSWQRDGGQTATTQLPLQNQHLIKPTGDMALDFANNRLLVRSGNSLMAVDLDSGERRPFSGGQAGQGPAFGAIAGMSVDPGANAIWVADNVEDVLWKVDLASGEGVAFSGENQGTGPLFQNPQGVQADPANSRVLVADSGYVEGPEEGLGGVFAVDTATGNRELIASALVGSGESLSFINDIQFDPAREELLLTRNSQQVMKVDLTTGVRANATDALGRVPTAIHMDTANDRILASLPGSLVSAKRTDGTVAEVAGDAVGVGPSLNWAGTFAVNAQGTSAWVAEREKQHVLSVDLGTGNRSVLSEPSVGDGLRLQEPVDIALVPDNPIAYVAANDLGTGFLFAVDLRDGSRTLVAGPETGSGAHIAKVGGVALDGETGDLYVTAVVNIYQDWGVIRIDPATGERTLVSSAGTNAERGEGREFSSLSDVAIDAANGRLLVLDDKDPALIAVDLETGDRDVISATSYDEAEPQTGTGEKLVNPKWMALDADNNRVLVTRDAPTDLLLAIDLASGNRTIVSGEADLTDDIVGSGPVIFSPAAVALDKAANRALLTTSHGVVAVDLATGNRAELVDSLQDRNAAVTLPGLPLLLTASETYRALELISLDEGRSVIVSQ